MPSKYIPIISYRKALNTHVKVTLCLVCSFSFCKIRRWYRIEQGILFDTLSSNLCYIYKFYNAFEWYTLEYPTSHMYFLERLVCMARK